MTIQCSIKWPEKMGDLHKQFTRFPERIIRSLPYPEYKLLTYFDLLAEQQNEKDWLAVTEFQDLPPKPHTIRWDKKNRWHEGRDIHFKFWLGSPYHSHPYQFTPIIKCTGVQRVEIKWYKEKPQAFPSYGYEVGNRFVRVFIEDRFIIASKIERLAINDGFESVEHFFRWFNEDFSGKLIHWTDLRY